MVGYEKFQRSAFSEIFKPAHRASTSRPAEMNKNNAGLFVNLCFEEFQIKPNVPYSAIMHLLRSQTLAELMPCSLRRLCLAETQFSPGFLSGPASPKSRSIHECEQWDVALMTINGCLCRNKCHSA